MACHRSRLKHSWSLLALTVFLVSLFLLLPSRSLFSNYRQAMVEEMSKRALVVANTTAILLSLNSLPYIELARAIQEDPEILDRKKYESLQVLLIKLRQDANMDYLYTQCKGEDSSAILVLGSLEEGKTLSSFSLQANKRVHFLQGTMAFQDATSQQTGLVEHERWGPSIFAHAPIKESAEGKVPGVVSAGFSITSLKKSFQNMLFLIVGLHLLTSILVALAICILLHLRERSLTVEYLTKLGTKQFFENQLTTIADHAKSSKIPFTLLLLDLDGFKQINDTYGHLTGDSVLQVVATIIRSHVQVSDICSRIGGDEFAIILTSSALEEALLTAQSIQNSIQCYSTEEYPELELSASIGVTQWSESQSTQEIIEQADQALYKAKKLGKNTVKHYPQDREMAL